MTRQNTKLTIMFILGLPGLLFACMSWLIDRYIVAYQMPPEKRFFNCKEVFIAAMFAYSMFIGFIGLIVWATRP